MSEPSMMASQEKTVIAVIVFLASHRRIAGVIIVIKDHGGGINF